MKNQFQTSLMCATALLLIIFYFGCTPQKLSHTPIAFTSILPHKYIAKRIAGDRFEIYALIKEGQSPHSYTPTAGQMAKISSATLFLRTGIQFEETILPKLKNTMSKFNVVDIRGGIAMRNNKCTHHHKDHSHHTNDPHIWLSPVLMKTQATTIKNAFVEIDPNGKEVYEANLKTLLTDLDSLNIYLHTILDPYKGSELFVFHPAFGYFADEYGLNQRAVEVGGKEPSVKALTHFINEALKYKPKVIFVQKQFSEKSANAIANQIKCVVAKINPLPENYIIEMRNMGKAIEKGLSK